MSATYSPNLRLVEQGTGDNVNTWGSVLNSGLIALVDTAIAGAASISLAAGSVTLTTANGATDQARSSALILTGALTANAVVTAPALTKAYIVQNATTGNFTVSLIPVGGSGVTITQGTIVLVWCDGSNMHFVTIPQSGNATSLGGVPAADFARLDVRSIFNLACLTRGQTINYNSGNYNTSAQQLQPNATAVPGASNVGTGTFGTISVADPALVGNYTLIMNSASAFSLYDPTATLVGTGTTGAPFNIGGISFTLSGGGTAFVAGDGFTIQTTIYGSNYFPVNMTASGVLTNPTDLPAGIAVQGLTWRIKQDPTGNRALTYGTMFKFLGSVTPPLSTAPNAVDIINGIYDPADNVIYCSFSQNFG